MLTTTMARTSKTPVIEHYISMKISESQYSVLQTISQVKAMTIDDYCQWALRQGLEKDIELHFGDGTKDRLLGGLQGESDT
jgi:hypothetical protein